MKKIILVTTVLLAFFACSNKEEKPQYQFPAGGGPIQAGPVQGGDDIKMLKELLAKDPKNLNAWITLGNKTMDSGRYNEAVEAYGKALEIDPKNVDVRVDFGTCNRSIGRPDIAAKEYRKAIEMNPNHLNAHKNLAVVLAYDLKDSAGAIKEFEKALQIAPGAPDAPQIKMEIERLKSGK
ncbi:MAG: tetratricopeptide repeat protein [Nitrospirae bacterium]|nr:tetratricopeptide repeat protein [Nitrospirota bacterium]